METLSKFLYEMKMGKKGGGKTGAERGAKFRGS